jgi:radical SAM-linked protein
VTERQRVHIIFRKSEGARYLSHLDLMATLEFSMRRAGLPVALSEGYNPRPRMSLVLPLVLGHTGEREVLELTLREPVAPDQLRERLQARVPPGIELLEILEVPADGKPAASRVRSATYRVDLSAGIVDLRQRCEQLMQREVIEIQEDHHGKIRIRDLRPLILSLHAPNTGTLRLRVEATGEGTVRPEQILDLLGVPREGSAITRESIEIG